MFLVWPEGPHKRDCRVKLEEANFVRDQDHLPKWTRPDKINGSPVLGLIDKNVLNQLFILGV